MSSYREINYCYGNSTGYFKLCLQILSKAKGEVCHAVQTSLKTMAADGDAIPSLFFFLLGSSNFQCYKYELQLLDP